MKITWFDKKLISLFPGFAVKRIRNKEKATQIVNKYESLEPSRLRKARGSFGSAEVVSGEASKGLRYLARELDENHDIASGILDIIVNNVVGTGIGIEPQIKDIDGNLLVDLNSQVSKIHDLWQEEPEVTGELKYHGCERMACRSWMRDGEVFTQKMPGFFSGGNYKSGVPFVIELIESDLCPTHLIDNHKKIRYGIKRNGFGRPMTYYFYHDHPGDRDIFSFGSLNDYKPISAKNIIHLKNVKRIRQGRGITVFSTVFGRLDDIRDMEEAERVAARLASAQVIKITRPLDASANTDNDREYQVEPAAIWEMPPGDDVEILSSDRPNNRLSEFVNDQLKRVASGVGAGHSSVSKTFDKSFAAQRQENVEQVGNYEVLQQFFIDHWCKPIYSEFMLMAQNSVLIIPDNIDISTLNDADFVPPVAPWIDPEKAIKAEVLAVKYRFKSQSQVVRERGNNPQKVREQIAKDNEADEAAGLEPLIFDNVNESSDNEERNN